MALSVSSNNDDGEAGDEPLSDGSDVILDPASRLALERKSEEERAEARRRRRQEIMEKHGVHADHAHAPKKARKTSKSMPAEANASKDAFAEMTAEAGLDMFSAHPEVGASNGVDAPESTCDHDAPAALKDNWNDEEGYYKARAGEVMHGRYKVLGMNGKGVFSTVMFATDAQSGNDVAIKLIRDNETMRRAAEKEMRLLKDIADADPAKKFNCIQLLDTFEHRQHICMVFEPMSMNMRETVNKFGRKVGISLGAVRAYTRQLFVALCLLKRVGIIHADLKPDNILITKDLSRVKICDFGSAFKADDPDNVETPYLVSRFYRAPEIVLGLPYNHSIDTWGIATCVYEFFTGRIMFPGRTNNHMLSLMQSSLQGKFPNKMIRKHISVYNEKFEKEAHFQSDYKFRQYEIDPVTKRTVLRVVTIHEAPSESMGKRLARSSSSESSERRAVAQFADLLSKTLSLDPARRMTCEDSLRHPFCKTNQTK